LTGIIFMLRSDSLVFDEQSIQFTDSGWLILTVRFMKRTKRKTASSTPIDKELPPGSFDKNRSKDVDEHPRDIYLRLMRLVVKLGGLPIVPSKKEAAPFITKLFKRVLGKERIKTFFKTGRHPSAHTLRKTGASAMDKTGCPRHGAVIEWGEWDSAESINSYVDKDYRISTFSRKLFDWLRM